MSQSGDNGGGPRPGLTPKVSTMRPPNPAEPARSKAPRAVFSKPPPEAPTDDVTRRAEVPSDLVDKAVRSSPPGLLRAHMPEPRHERGDPTGAQDFRAADGAAPRYDSYPALDAERMPPAGTAIPGIPSARPQATDDATGVVPARMTPTAPGRKPQGDPAPSKVSTQRPPARTATPVRARVMTEPMHSHVATQRPPAPPAATPRPAIASQVATGRPPAPRATPGRSLAATQLGTGAAGATAPPPAPRSRPDPALAATQLGTPPPRASTTKPPPVASARPPAPAPAPAPHRSHTPMPTPPAQPRPQVRQPAVKLQLDTLDAGVMPAAGSGPPQGRASTPGLAFDDSIAPPVPMQRRSMLPMLVGVFMLGAVGSWLVLGGGPSEPEAATPAAEATPAAPAVPATPEPSQPPAAEVPALEAAPEVAQPAAAPAPPAAAAAEPEQTREDKPRSARATERRPADKPVEEPRRAKPAEEEDEAYVRRALAGAVADKPAPEAAPQPEAAIPPPLPPPAPDPVISVTRKPAAGPAPSNLPQPIAAPKPGGSAPLPQPLQPAPAAPAPPPRSDPVVKVEPSAPPPPAPTP